MLLAGVGNLGSALLGYPALRAENFKIVGAFDDDPGKIGKDVWGLAVKDIANIVAENAELKARIGIIAVPASAAQEVAEAIVEANVPTILNFAPVVLKLPKHIVVRNVDFVQELAVLSFHLTEKG